MSSDEITTYGGAAAREEGLMAPTICISVQRSVRLRGGRGILRGAQLAAQVTEGGFLVAHPSGIEGAFAFIPATHAAAISSRRDDRPDCYECGDGGYTLRGVCTSCNAAESDEVLA